MALVSKIPPIRRSPVDLTLQQKAVGVSAGPQTTFLPAILQFDDLTNHRFAMASVGLGAFGCLIGIGSPLSAIIGAMGVLCGLIGTQSKRNDMATLGLVLSVIALFLGVGQVAFDVWTRYQSREWIRELQGIQ